MKNLRKNQKGFTLIELIMVIVVLGILAAVAFPIYGDMTNRARSGAEQGVVGGVRAAIATHHARQNPPAYPANGDIDNTGDGLACDATNPCFDGILAQGGITDGTLTAGWSKVDSNTWRHIGENTRDYDYTAASGTFVCNSTTSTCP